MARIVPRVFDDADTEAPLALAEELEAGSSMQDILDSYNATVKPIFALDQKGSTGFQALASSSAAAWSPGDLASDDNHLTPFRHVDAPVEHLDEIAEKLQALDDVDNAFVKPRVVQPLAYEMPPVAPSVPAKIRTPNFAPLQTYFNAAPAGFDFTWAGTLPGGRGAGVTIIDCEGGVLAKARRHCRPV